MDFDQLKQELTALREGAGLFDAGALDQGQLQIQGADATSYLHRMTSNEVQKLPIGEGRYNALLDRKGRILSLFYMFHPGENDFRIITPPQLTQKTHDILMKMKLVLKVTIQDLSRESGLLWLIGPKAGELVTQERECLIWKDDVFGPPVWNISGPRNLIQEIAGELSAKTVGLHDESIRLMKVAAGFPEYGVDVDESHILLELNLPYFYQRNKGCYPGQEVVERILAYGKGRTPRSLCKLTLEGEQKIAPKTEIVTPSGERAGVVTSAAYNPLDSKTFILAYLDHKFVDGAEGLEMKGERLTLTHKPPG